VVVVVLLAVMAVVAPIAVYLWVSALRVSPSCAVHYFGIVLSKSPDGSEWNLTFTAVLNGMNSSNTYLSLTAPSSAQALAPTALSSLPGGNVPLSDSLGQLYLGFHQSFPGQITGGDTIYIGTSTAAGTSITGYNAHIAWKTTSSCADWSAVLH